MLNSINFNYNRLVALHIQPMKTNEFIEICIYPMNNKYEPCKTILPFWTLVKPRKSPYYIPEETNYKEEYGVHENKYLTAFNQGNDRVQLFDLFERWFNEKINILEGRKLMPIVYDWASTKPYLIDWMGETNFNHYFHFHVRDILPLAIYFNDWCNMNIQRPPFQKVDINYIFSSIKTYHESNDCIVQAHAIAETYRYMLNYVRGTL